MRSVIAPTSRPGLDYLPRLLRLRERPANLWLWLGSRAYVGGESMFRVCSWNKGILSACLTLLLSACINDPLSEEREVDSSNSAVTGECANSSDCTAPQCNRGLCKCDLHLDLRYWVPPERPGEPNVVCRQYDHYVVWTQRGRLYRSNAKQRDRRLRRVFLFLQLRHGEWLHPAGGWQLPPRVCDRFRLPRSELWVRG